jgi:hypothetical protein
MKITKLAITCISMAALLFSFCRPDDQEPWNLYISSKYCRACFSSVKGTLNDLTHVDTLFIVTEKDKGLQLQNMHRLLGKLLDSIAVSDTVYGNYEGFIFSNETHTNFHDSGLNSLFFKSSPFLFQRTSNNGIRILK